MCYSLLAVISSSASQQDFEQVIFLNGNRKKGIKRATEKDWNLEQSFTD